MKYAHSQAALAAALFSVVLPVFAQGASGYAYPYEDPFVATGTFALLESRYTQRPGAYVELSILPGRKEVPHLEEYGRLGLLFYEQDGAAPLVLLIPGLGGYSLDNAPQWVAEHFWAQGFHVIVLPSAFNWRFAIAASTTGRPGITRMDARDLLRVIRTALTHWKTEIRKPIRSVGLLGYSLGGLQAAFVAHAWNPEAMGFALRRTLLINPPVDLAYGMRQLDAFYATAARWDPPTARRIQNELAGAARTYVIDHDIDDPGYFEDLEKKFAFSRAEYRFGIGARFNQVLAKVIFASQQVYDLGILHAPVDPPRFVARLDEAKQFGFEDYYRRFLLPHAAEETPEELFYNNSFRSIEHTLRNDETIFLMHNRDDILVEDEDLEYLGRIFEHRAGIYSDGGHLGNLWFPENLEDMVDTFRLNSEVDEPVQDEPVQAFDNSKGEARL